MEGQGDLPNLNIHPGLLNEGNSYTAVNERFMNMDWTRQTMFGTRLYRYFVLQQKTRELMSWAIQGELNGASTIGELFRSDNVATKLLYCQLFNKLGQQYLSTFLLPLIATITGHRGLLEIEEQKVGPEIAKKNVEWLLELLGGFLDTLVEACHACPLEIRETLFAMERGIRNKFPSEDSQAVIASIVFLRYFTPTIVDPMKYGIFSPLHEGEMTRDMQRGLILVSKLLQAMANRSVASFESPKIAPENSKMIVNFVEYHQPTLHKFVAELTEESLIQRLQSTRQKHDVQNPEIQAELEELEEELQAIMEGTLTEEPSKNGKGDNMRKGHHKKKCFKGKPPRKLYVL